MNECCDWHAICLNDKEEVQVENNVVERYISYCPECNTLFEYENSQLSKIEGEKRNYYIEKYQDKINTSKTK